MWGCLRHQLREWATVWERDGTGRSKLGARWSGLKIINRCLAIERCFYDLFLMCVCTIECVRTCVWAQGQTKLSSLGTPSTCFEEGSLVDLEFTSWERTAGQWTPESLLSLPPQHWGYRNMCYARISMWVLRNKLRSSYSQSRFSTDWAVPLVPRQGIQNQNTGLISKLAQLWKQNIHLLLVISPGLSCAKKVTKHSLSHRFLILQEGMMEAAE